MATTALCGSTDVFDYKYAPKNSQTREIIREEIRRQHKINNLEEKYKNGEISKVEYNVQKAILNMPVVFDKVNQSTMHYIA